jgi:hypothetical protein
MWKGALMVMTSVLEKALGLLTNKFSFLLLLLFFFF